MAKKKESITEQISSLEAELKDKSDRLKSYDKILDKILKEVFGKTRSEIDALISNDNSDAKKEDNCSKNKSDKKSKKQTEETDSETLSQQENESPE